MSARRESVRILLTIAFRNLGVSPVRTGILGAIILIGSLVVVVGTSMLDSIDRGVRTSIQGSLGGHLQLYDGRSEDQLALYGDMTGESRLEPIEDFSKVKAVLAKVPNVKQVVPMGIDQAMVATGNTFDLALERLRNDVRRLEEGASDPALQASYVAHLAHVRHMADLLKGQLAEARTIADLDGKEGRERRKEWQDLLRATDPAFWAAFDRDRYGSLEFLENKIAPQVLDGGFTFLRYVGTDPQAFFEAFPLAEISKGEMIPDGRRGVLVGEQYADEWLKLKNARRLDLLKDARDRLGRRIAKDEELQRWVRENGTGMREILLQLDPVRAEEVAAELRKGLAAPGGESLEQLLAQLFATTDDDLDAKYRLFYAAVAPRIRLYQVNVGETITIKAPSKSGYFSSVNVKVYGFLRFKGIERSNIAGMMSVLDIHSFRDLYGYLTPEKKEEIARMKAQLGAREIAREDAEAALFGGGGGELVRQATSGAIDDRALVGGGAPKPGGPLEAEERLYTRDDVERGVALNAAVILEDPRRQRATQAAIEQALTAAGLGYRETKGPDGEVVKDGVRVIDWQAASGIVGQFVTLIRIVLFTAILIFFSIALVIINNAMVMATLQRVKEIGTMRAIGTQRRFVVTMLIVEIATIGLVFGLGGALLGAGTVWGIRLAGGIPATTDMLFFLYSGPALLPRLGALAVGTSLTIVLLVSILSALYPALLAMRVTPVEAMATEE
jgi:ABC-type lipoprotein release transport system permease subunit